MRRPWRLLRSGPGAPAFNLALDEILLRSSDLRPILRLYEWSPPALSLGRFQRAADFISRATAAGLTLCRRPTGGGAIHHDDELTFCIVGTPGRDGIPADVVDQYRLVHALVRDALATLGARVHPRGGNAPLSTRPRTAKLCFEDVTSLDLVDDEGRKVVGSAQRRTAGRVLHHGSIVLHPPALSPGSGSVGLSAGRSVAWDEAAGAVQAAFERGLGCRFEVITLSHEERKAAEELSIARSIEAGPRGWRSRAAQASPSHRGDVAECSPGTARPAGRSSHERET